MSQSCPCRDYISLLVSPASPYLVTGHRSLMLRFKLLRLQRSFIGNSGSSPISVGTLDGKTLRGNVNRFPLPAPVPIAETYFEKNRLIEDMFCHEKLEVYQKSVELLNRLLVLFASSSLNIAGCAGKTGVADKKLY